jgi:hypothetical protein
MSGHPMNRREFAGVTAGLATSAIAVGGSAAGNDAAEAWDPDRPPVCTAKKLRVQPIFMYTTYQPRPQTSWKSWSGINTREAAAEEAGRIGKELVALGAGAGFPLEILPLATVTTPEQARQVHDKDYDVVLIYPATGSGSVLRACYPQKPDRDAIIFVRHRSGPVYYWYEALSSAYLKKATDEEVAQNSARNHGGVTIHDAVVDDYAEVAWRLRALGGLKNFIGQRIVALGKAQGKYAPEAPKVARDKFELAIIEVGYDELVERIKRARANADLVAQAEKWTDRYLALPNTRLATKREFVRNAFILYRIIKDWMREHQAPAFTIEQCMGTVMPIAQTTACMPLSWLNDAGWAAFCESDFVIIPAGMLLYFITGRPVFLHNSTFPHKGIVTCAHCTAPRRMDGKRYEPVQILTHYESDYGAAPKVEMPVGQQVTFVDPEYATGRWLGFRGVVKANPFLEICRSQQDVEIQGDWKRLLGEARDSHWMMAYGDYLKELGYAARKIGIRWVDLSEKA